MGLTLRREHRDRCPRRRRYQPRVQSPSSPDRETVVRSGCHADTTLMQGSRPSTGSERGGVDLQKKPTNKRKTRTCQLVSREMPETMRRNPGGRLARTSLSASYGSRRGRVSLANSTTMLDNVSARRSVGRYTWDRAYFAPMKLLPLNC